MRKSQPLYGLNVRDEKSLNLLLIESGFSVLREVSATPVGGYKEGMLKRNQ